jgi:hypothetical protein
MGGAFLSELEAGGVGHLSPPVQMASRARQPQGHSQHRAAYTHFDARCRFPGSGAPGEKQAPVSFEPARYPERPLSVSVSRFLPRAVTRGGLSLHARPRLSLRMRALLQSIEVAQEVVSHGERSTTERTVKVASRRGSFEREHV